MKTVYETLQSQGGLTTDYTGREIKYFTGYQVAKENIATIPNNEETFNLYMDSLKEEIIAGEFMGLWLENNIIYIDRSYFIKDRAEAVKTGLMNHQISIYDWANEECIYLN